MSALIALNEEGLLAYERRMTMLRKDCEVMGADHVERASEVRSTRSASRARSAGGRASEETAADRYRTARKFSVARARVLSQTTGEDMEQGPWTGTLAGSSNRARSAQRAGPAHRFSPRDRAVSSYSRYE